MPISFLCAEAGAIRRWTDTTYTALGMSDRGSCTVSVTYLALPSEEEGVDGDEPHGLVDPFGARISQTKNRSAPRRRRDTARRSRRGDRLTTTIDHETMDAGEDGRKRLELASRKEERRIERGARG